MTTKEEPDLQDTVYHPVEEADRVAKEAVSQSTRIGYRTEPLSGMCPPSDFANLG